MLRTWAADGAGGADAWVGPSELSLYSRLYTLKPQAWVSRPGCPSCLGQDHCAGCGPALPLSGVLCVPGFVILSDVIFAVTQVGSVVQPGEALGPRPPAGKNECQDSNLCVRENAVCGHHEEGAALALTSRSAKPGRWHSGRFIAAGCFSRPCLSV